MTYKSRVQKVGVVSKIIRRRNSFVQASDRCRALLQYAYAGAIAAEHAVDGFERAIAKPEACPIPSDHAELKMLEMFRDQLQRQKDYLMKYAGEIPAEVDS